MMKRAGRVRSRAAERPRRTNVPHQGHVPWHGDEYFFKWYYGVLDPLKWMHDHYRLIHTRQWPDALLSRVNQGLVIIQVSSRWEESREENNPLLLCTGQNGWRSGRYDVCRRSGRFREAGHEKVGNTKCAGQ